MAIYFLRHGESEANVVRLFAGQKEDSPLTKLGIEQANLAANELLKKGITKIVSSHLVRAVETAKIVAEVIGVEHIDYDDRLLEYDMGNLTGTPHRKVTSNELVSTEGAENPQAFQGRVLAALRDIRLNEGNVLIVSHAGVGRIIEVARQNLAPSTFYDLEAYPNAHAIKLDLDWL